MPRDSLRKKKKEKRKKEKRKKKKKKEKRKKKKEKGGKSGEEKRLLVSVGVGKMCKDGAQNLVGSFTNLVILKNCSYPSE